MTMEALRSLAALASTTALLLALLALHPFRWINRGLDWAFDAAPEWTQVRTLVRNPVLHEVTSGERPLAGFRGLEADWAARRDPSSPRVVFTGNSQMQTMSLAPGEERPQAQELTYFDHIQRQLAASDTLSFRLSAGGLNYQEALWELEYFLQRPALKPSVVMLQVNYQAFGLSGIREGMLELLDDAAFRQRIEQRSAEGKPFSGSFLEALRRYQRKAKPEAQPVETSWLQFGFAGKLETWTRSVFDAYPLFKDRSVQREELYDTLYRGRLYALRIKPSGARSIRGGVLQLSRSALEAAVIACQEKGVRVVLFLAPVNPEVNLFKTKEDEESYRQFATDLAAKHQVRLYDFEKAIPAAMWGRYYNSPDPLHMGREAHRRFAEQLIPVVREALTKEALKK